MNPTHEQIALRAWEIYQHSGCQDGSAESHWAQAVEELTEPALPPENERPAEAAGEDFC